MKFNYNKQNITEQDISSVVKTLRSERITQGKKLQEFELLLKKYFKCRYCAVVSSGTAAQFLLAKSLNWKEKDNIILSPLTFVSGANSILSSNSTPIFVDIKKDDQNLDPILVEKKIIELKKRKKNVRAIIVTDYGGQPADWANFRKIANKHKLKLINDNCHALGSKYNGDKSYAIKYADFIIQSFHAVKNITTGEGGAVLTNDKKIYEKIKQFREHGFFKKKSHLVPWNYNLKDFGYNFRLSDINCSIGCNQIKRIDQIVKKRRLIAKHYDNFFKDYDFISVPNIFKNKKNSYHLYPIQIDFKALDLSSKKFYLNLKKKFKIELQKHYIPTYRFTLYRKKFKNNYKNFKNTEIFFENSFSIPLHLKLSLKNIKFICNGIIKSLK